MYGQYYMFAKYYENIKLILIKQTYIKFYKTLITVSDQLINYEL